MEIGVENGRVAYPFSVEIDSISGKMDIDVTHIERFFSNLVNVFIAPTHFIIGGNLNA